MRLLKIRSLGFLLAALPVIVHSQPGPGKAGDGWGRGSGYQRLFNPKTMETIEGEIVSIDTFSVVQGGRPGIHLEVAAKKDTVSVHLGPAWFIENQEMALAAGDSVEIKGSKVPFNGGTALIASEVRKGKDVLTLRNGKGIPAWSGWRRR